MTASKTAALLRIMGTEEFKEALVQAAGRASLDSPEAQQ